MLTDIISPFDAASGGSRLGVFGKVAGFTGDLDGKLGSCCAGAPRFDVFVDAATGSNEPPGFCCGIC